MIFLKSIDVILYRKKLLKINGRFFYFYLVSLKRDGYLFTKNKY